METISCIICGSDKSEPYIQVSDRLQKDDIIFQLVKCECCFVYLNPRPDETEISKYYTSEEYAPHLEKTTNFTDKCYKFVQMFTLRWKHRKISVFKKKGKLLDIGGGQGEFCRYMQNNGWNVLLQDNTSQVLKNADNSGIPTITSINDIDSTEKFDVITMWHSLEHIHKIHDTAKKIRNHLEKDGILLIAVPNVDALEQKYFNESWAPFDAPRHLYHFSPSSLKWFLGKFGVKIEKEIPMFQDTPYNILLSLKSKNIFQLARAGIIWLISSMKTLTKGINHSSSFLVICKKK